MGKRILSVILVVVVMITSVDVSVFASELSESVGEGIRAQAEEVEVGNADAGDNDISLGETGALSEIEAVYTAKSTASLNTDVRNKILSYKSKYPEGKNWDPNNNGWKDLAWECYGFAITMAGLLFKDYPTNAHIRSTANGKIVEGWTCYYVNNNNYNSLVVEPGDIIDCPTGWYKNKKGETVMGSHTAMVLSNDNGKITCVQANNGGNNYVYWNQCFNYNNNNSTLKKIYEKYSSYITGSGSRVFRLWKPSDSLKQNAKAYSVATGPSQLKISGQTYPPTLTQGSSWTCKGTITSNYNITHVGGYILKFNGSEETVVYSKTVNPNSTSYSLANSDIDKALLFNKLSAGTYYYKITLNCNPRFPSKGER